MGGGVLPPPPANSTPPERGEDWWYGISHDDEVAYTSNVNRARYDISRGCRVNNAQAEGPAETPPLVCLIRHDCRNGQCDYF